MSTEDSMLDARIAELRPAEVASLGLIGLEIERVLTARGWNTVLVPDRLLITSKKDQYTMQFAYLFSSMEISDGTQNYTVFWSTPKTGGFKSFSGLEFTLADIPHHLENAAEEPEVLVSRLESYYKNY